MATSTEWGRPEQFRNVSLKGRILWSRIKAEPWETCEVNEEHSKASRRTPWTCKRECVGLEVRRSVLVGGFKIGWRDSWRARDSTPLQSVWRTLPCP